MDLVGTPQCPHLGFGARDGRPCCHADDATRLACGKWAPNPQARAAGADANISGLDPYFCTVLGTESLPPAALKLAAQEKARLAAPRSSAPKGFRPPSEVTGRQDSRPAREQDAESDQPVIPTHTLRTEGRRIGPNERCPCGSGKKYKKCCGREA